MADTQTIGKLLVQVLLDQRPFIDGLTLVQASLRSGAQAMKSLGQDASAAFGAAREVLGYAAKAVPVVAVGFAKLASDVMDARLQLKELSTRSGLSTETLAGISYAAKSSASSIDTLKSSLSQFPKRVADAARGTGEAKIAFDALKVSVKDSNGNLRSTDEVLREVAAKLQAIPDKGTRAALATQAFGEAGGLLMEALGQTSLEDYVEVARKWGEDVSPKAIAGAAEYAAAIAELGLVVEGTKAQLVDMFDIGGSIRAFTLGLVYAKTYFTETVSVMLAKWTLFKEALTLPWDSDADAMVEFDRKVRILQQREDQIPDTARGAARALFEQRRETEAAGVAADGTGIDLEHLSDAMGGVAAASKAAAEAEAKWVAGLSKLSDQTVEQLDGREALRDAYEREVAAINAEERALLASARTEDDRRDATETAAAARELAERKYAASVAAYAQQSYLDTRDTLRKREEAHAALLRSTEEQERQETETVREQAVARATAVAAQVQFQAQAAQDAFQRSREDAERQSAKAKAAAVGVLHAVVDAAKTATGMVRDAFGVLSDGWSTLYGWFQRITGFSVDFSAGAAAYQDAAEEGGASAGRAAARAFIDGLVRDAVDFVRALADSLPVMILALVREIPSLIKAVVASLPELFDALVRGIPLLVDAIADGIPTVLQAVIDGLPRVVDALSQGAERIADMIADQFPRLIDQFMDALPGMIQQSTAALTDIIVALVGTLDEFIGGIFDAIPTMIESLLRAIPRIIVALLRELPKVVERIIDSIPEIITALVEGLLRAIPRIIAGVIRAIPALIVSIIQGIPDIIRAIVGLIPVIIRRLVESIPTLVTALADSLPDLLPALIALVPEVVLAIIEAIPQIIVALFDALFVELPRQIPRIISELATAIWEAIVQAVKAAGDALKGFFGGLFGGGKNDKSTSALTGYTYVPATMRAVLHAGDVVLSDRAPYGRGAPSAAAGNPPPPPPGGSTGASSSAPVELAVVVDGRVLDAVMVDASRSGKAPGITRIARRRGGAVVKPGLDLGRFAYYSSG